MKMNFNLDKLLRPNVKNIKPYSSARDEYNGEASVFLDANENSLGSIGIENRNRYPDPHQNQLKTALGKLKNIETDKIFLGNGSDEVIDLIYRTFCVPATDKSIIMPPTYGMYQVCADINDVETVKIPLIDDFQIDTKNVLKAVDNNTKLIFICSPNNPSGNCLKESDITNILNNTSCIVVIDEAYNDFAQQPSWITKLDKHPNLIVLQTFSKAWGLANIRLGMAFASAEICKIMDKIKPPYNVNGITQELGIKALQNKDIFETRRNSILSEREKLITELKQIPIIKRIFPTDANFILVKTENPREIYNYLVTKNIIVRDRSSQHLCEGCLRITVGSEDENIALIEALNSFQK